MNEKLNLDAVAQYSEEYAEKVMDTHFRSGDRINGNEILNLGNVKQVNLLVLHEIFKSWQEESRKNRSPYFDYSAPDVRDALDQLMNTLSNNISVSRQDFSPLVRKAVYDALLLIVDPYDFYADMIEQQPDPLSIATFRNKLKYLKINKAPLERLLAKMEEGNRTTISSAEAFGMLDDILEEVNFSPEDINPFMAKFSMIVPVTVDRFYQPRNTAAHHEEKTISEESPAIASTPEIRVSPSGIQLPTATSTVNDRHATGPRPTIADHFKRIASIREHLTINQKFMFTKVLFHGDFELFSKAVDDLDRQDTITGAMKYLEQNYSEWDQESEEFHEFMELIEKRFNS